MFISHIDYAMFISHIDYAIFTKVVFIQMVCRVRWLPYRWYVVYAGCHTDGMSCTLYGGCITRCFNNEKLVTALKKNNFTDPSENNKQI